jgi:hypothetical protein
VGSKFVGGKCSFNLSMVAKPVVLWSSSKYAMHIVARLIAAYRNTLTGILVGPVAEQDTNLEHVES